jgi:hypothetical protein
MVALQAYGSAVDPVTTKIAFDPDTTIFASEPEKSEAINLILVPTIEALPPTLLIVDLISPVIVSLEPVPYPVTNAIIDTEEDTFNASEYKEPVGTVVDVLPDT